MLRCQSNGFTVELQNSSGMTRAEPRVGQTQARRDAALATYEKAIRNAVELYQSLGTDPAIAAPPATR